MKLIEGNVDGLVGPTHNYAGLAFGNVAAEGNAGQVSNPRMAALQGLAKMRTLHDLGIPQMVMPPHPRPHTGLLRNLGFHGNARAQIEAAAKHAPQLLPYVYSASGMWAANAATVTPSVDAADGKVHFTPANLVSTAHRAIEPMHASAALRVLFPGEGFVHHDPLPANLLFADEGAANHMRLQRTDGTGLHVFVYGREAVSFLQYTTRYPARQALAASQSIAHRHGIADKDSIFVRQHPVAIDAGVFHNDVISTSHDNVLFYHELAFADGEQAAQAIAAKADNPHLVKVLAEEVNLEDAVKSYLFNSQIVSLPGGGMVLIAPKEAENTASVHSLLARISRDNATPISEVRYLDLRESMRNGGGPACLRLRVQLTEDEWKQVHQPAVFSHGLHERLEAWVKKHYREQLSAADLKDPSLAEEAQAACDELAQIMQLGSLYEFQR